MRTIIGLLVVATYCAALAVGSLLVGGAVGWLLINL